MPTKVFSPTKNNNHAKRIKPQPIKLKRRTPTRFTYLPTKEAVSAPATPQKSQHTDYIAVGEERSLSHFKSQTGPHGKEGTEIQCRPNRIKCVVADILSLRLTEISSGRYIFLGSWFEYREGLFNTTIAQINIMPAAM